MAHILSKKPKGNNSYGAVEVFRKNWLEKVQHFPSSLTTNCKTKIYFQWYAFTQTHTHTHTHTNKIQKLSLAGFLKIVVLKTFKVLKKSSKLEL